MNSSESSVQPPPSTAKGRRLTVMAMIGLAALGVPRVVLHDLHIIDEGHPASWILSLGPVAVWVAVVVWKNVQRPFLSVLTVGLIFGVMLVITHQLLWGYLYEEQPAFHGNDATIGVIPRLAVIPGGVFAGALLGAMGGLIAWALRALLDRTTRR